MSWQIRYQGSGVILSVDSAQKVLEGLRDDEWQPGDDVRGPNDEEWVAIEDHPLFAEVVAEMVPPPEEAPDETKLDMNPLIDVALVLLIFFILTTTYSSLRHSIEVPPPSEDKPGAEAKKTKVEDVIERVFKVEAWMDGDTPRVKIEDKLVELEDIDKEVKAVVASSRKNEMLLEVDGKVPWGVEAMIHDAAKGADIHKIWRKPKKPAT